MRVTLSVALVTLLFAAITGNGQGTNDELFVIGTYIQHGDPFDFEPCNAHDYFVKWEKIPSREWEPGAPFPLSLVSETVRARSFLSKDMQITNELQLSSIKIARLRASSDLAAAHGKSPAGLRKRWFMLINFDLQPTQPLHYCRHGVLVLMDGSYGTERPMAEGTAAPARERAIDKKGISRAATLRSISNGPDPYQRLNYDPDFVIPKVQWKPFVAAFPLDLSAEALRAKDYLTKEGLSAGESVVLAEIRVDPYLPTEAIRASNLSFLDNLNHWVVVFRFAKDAEDATGGYSVFMLLDGTILQTTEQQFSPRS